MPTVAVGNIRNNPPMPHTHVVQDCQKLAHLGSITIANEMGPRLYKEALAKAVTRFGSRVRVEGKKTLIALPLKWPVYRDGTARLTDPFAGINPARTVEHVHTRDFLDAPTVVAGTHFTNGAFNRKNKPAKLWRKWAWNRQHRKTRRLVRRWHKAGWNVILGGDFNRLRTLDLHPNQVVAHQAGLIHLYAIPAPGYTVDVRAKRTVTNVHTDHPFIRAFIQFAKEES